MNIERARELLKYAKHHNKQTWGVEFMTMSVEVYNELVASITGYSSCTKCNAPNGIHKITYAYNDEVKMLCCKCYREWGGGAFCQGNCIEKANNDTTEGVKE